MYTVLCHLYEIMRRRYVVATMNVFYLLPLRVNVVSCDILKVNDTLMTSGLRHAGFRLLYSG